MNTTNKIIPSSTVVVSADVRRWVPRIVIALAVIIVLATIASIVHKYDAQKQSNAPQSSSRSAEVLPEKMPPQTLRIPANGDSATVNPPVGYVVSFTGDGLFNTHCVYQDGRSEGIVGDPVHPCGDGPISYVYAHNREIGREISVTYTIHKP